MSDKYQPQPQAKKNIVDGVTYVQGKEVKTEPINYKKETPKHPNGAEIFAPEGGTKYYYKSYNYEEVSNTTWDKMSRNDITNLKRQNLFLEKYKCCCSIILEKRHLEIVQKVYEINAENGWVADWNDENQSKYFCYWRYDERFGGMKWNHTVTNQSGGEVYFCHQAQDYLKTLSIADQKAFLLIY